MPIIFLDIETTGLSPIQGKILEIAAIATDDNFNELGRFHVVTDEAAKLTLGSLDRKVQQMHLDNGLWLESASPPSHTGNEHADITAIEKREMRHVDRALVKFITDHSNGTPPQLAGNTISFDRSFLAVHLPQSHGALHYRNFDVTTLNELARRLFPALHEGRPQRTSIHRAMPDIELSLATARYYASAFTNWKDVGTQTLTVKVPAEIDADALARLMASPQPRAIMIDTDTSLTAGMPDDVFRGLRAMTLLPVTSLSKSLRTDDVIAAIAWLKASLPDVPVAIPEGGDL